MLAIIVRRNRLRAPEPTAATRNRCMEPLKINKCFTATKAEIVKLGEGKDVSERVWNMDKTGFNSSTDRIKFWQENV